MKVVVIPAESAVAVDGVSHVLAPFPSDSGDTARPLKAIIYDGVTGQIERRSRVPGRTDIEHFMDEKVLDPYVNAWKARQAAIDEDKARQAAEMSELGRKEQAAIEEAQAKGAAARAAEVKV